MWWLRFTAAYCLYWGELMYPFRRSMTLLICCIKEWLSRCPRGDVKELFIKYDIMYVSITLALLEVFYLPKFEIWSILNAADQKNYVKLYNYFENNQGAPFWQEDSPLIWLNLVAVPRLTSVFLNRSNTRAILVDENKKSLLNGKTRRVSTAIAVLAF